jgi:hypothetical protein
MKIKPFGATGENVIAAMSLRDNDIVQGVSKKREFRQEWHSIGDQNAARR